MTYKNYTSDPVTINGVTVEPHKGKVTLKPQEDVTYILPPKLWSKVKHRKDVISIHKGAVYGLHDHPDSRTP